MLAVDERRWAGDSLDKLTVVADFVQAAQTTPFPSLGSLQSHESLL
jgi:hypothetical protein